MFLLRQVRLNLFYQILPLLDLFLASLYFEKVPRPKREGKVGGSHTEKLLFGPKDSRIREEGGESTKLYESSERKTHHIE